MQYHLSYSFLFYRNPIPDTDLRSPIVSINKSASIADSARMTVSNASSPAVSYDGQAPVSNTENNFSRTEHSLHRAKRQAFYRVTDEALLAETT